MSSEWIICRLEDVIHVRHGFAFKSEFFTDNQTSYQLVTPGNFSIGGGFQLGKGKFYSGPIPDEYVLKRGDVIVTMTDLSRGADTLGYAAVVPEIEGITWLHNQRVGLIQIKDLNAVDSGYLHYLMRSPEYRHWVVASATGSTVKHTAPNRICSFEFMRPDLDEQKAISTTLGALDDRIALLRETNATLEAIAQALFKSWFVDFDPVHAKARGEPPQGMDDVTAAQFPDSFEESEQGMIPKEWKISTIGDVCNLGRGSSPRPIQNFMGNDIPWIKIADATASDGMFIFSTKEKIKKEGAPKSVSVRHGDLIMSNSASCGIPAFVELEGCIHDGWLYFKDFDGVSKNLLFFWLRKISKHLVHIADGSVQKNLNTTLVSSQWIINPPELVLKTFDSHIQPLMDRIRENCLQAQTLAQLRDTLLPKLISGQLRLPEAEALLAEELP